MAEFESMSSVLKAAKYAGNLVLPFKFRKADFNWKRLENCYQTVELTTPDITETVKNVFVNQNHKVPGGCYRLNDNERNALAGTPDAHHIYITAKGNAADDNSTHEMSLFGSMLYVFKTGIAFIVLQLMYEDISVPKDVTHLGLTNSNIDYYYKDGEGYHIFDFNQSVKEYAAQLGLTPFFEKSVSLFLEAYICNYALVSESFASLDTLRQACFNMHLLKPFDQVYEDDSENDIRYVYAAKNRERNVYRWGCCVTSQTISYITADPNMDIENEIQRQTRASIPLVVLALYQKYSCMRFTEQLLMEHSDIGQIKKDMLDFRAYGTFRAPMVSRWNNIREIYGNLMELNGIYEAIEEINDKVNVVDSYQRDKAESREKLITWIITIFGIISIEDSILSVVQSLQGGDALIWDSARISIIVLGVVLVGTLIGIFNKNQ